MRNRPSRVGACAALAPVWNALILSLLLLAGLAPTAAADIRVEILRDGGLFVHEEGTVGVNDAITLGLFSTNQGLEWRVTDACAKDCVLHPQLYVAGPGCDKRPDGVIRCARQAGAVSIALTDGNDKFSIASGSLPITEPMTISMGTGDDVASGGSGNDTMSGNAGNDFLGGFGGNDSIGGNAGNDQVDGGPGDDTLTGSDGDDRMFPGPGKDTANAGTGADLVDLGAAVTSHDARDDVNGGADRDRVTYLTYPVAVRIVEGNLETLGFARDGTGESDVLRAFEVYEGSGKDDILTGVLSSNDSDYLGGPGNDQIFGSKGNNTIEGGAGSDELDGNEGDDTIDGKKGEGGVATPDPVIDCGTGVNDRAIIDLQDDHTPAGCKDENIFRGAAGEGPHVELLFGRVVSVHGSSLSVRLRCPRALHHRCQGTLRLRLGSAQTAAAHYSVASARTRTVSVSLGGLSGRIGRRTVGQLISLEKGDVRGIKTTQRRIVLRRSS